VWKWLANTVFIPFRDAVRRLLAKLIPKPPGTPKKIPFDPAQVPTGPNLVKNPSFELGAFTPGVGSMTVTGSGVIDNWRIGATTQALWVNALVSKFNPASDGTRLLDLTGGLPPSPTRKLGVATQPFSLGLQAGNSYEVAIDIGVGPFDGPLANFGPPVKVSVNILGLTEVFLCNPVDIPESGVKWERFSFRIAYPAGYAFGKSDWITIHGVFGTQFIGVDNVSVRQLT
jgi:hypothetical protein